MPIWIQIVVLIIFLSIIVMLILENRHPVKTIAWILVLTFLPGLGLVFYLFFGLDNRRKRLVSEEDLMNFKTLSAKQQAEDIFTDTPPYCKDLVNLLWSTNMAIPLEGNDVKLYTDFDPMMQDMLKDLESARHHIHFEFFKFEDDDVGRRVEEVLKRKVAEGVEVRVQYDDAANLLRKMFYRRMKKAGVMVAPFIKVVLPFLSRNTNYRNHRKVVVVDGRVGYVGGMNIARRYSEGIHGGNWRDTHMRVTGPVVSEMQTCFLMDWQFSTKEHLSDEKYYPKQPRTGNVRMQLATSGPMDEWRVIMQAMIKLISNSHEYVYIHSPYFVPTESVMLALRNAALAGIDVRVMLPSRGDRGVTVQLASRSYVDDLLSAGVRVFFYKKGYMHSKAIVADDMISTVGSSNMDIRSFEQNFEVNGFMYDESVALQLKEAFLKDQEDCDEILEEEWNKRPKSKVFRESLARLLSPLL